jgi:hypothetical protein
MDEQEKSMVKMQASMTTMYKHYKNYLCTANKRMIAMEQNVSAHLHAPRSQAQEGMFNFGQENNNGGNDIRNDVQSLCAEIAEMRKHSEARQAGVVSAPSGDPMLWRDLKQAVETRVTTTETCTIGGTSFTSDVLVGTYITTHTVPSCAVYCDLFSILVCMGGQGLTGKERSDKIYSAERSRDGSVLEGELVASMTHKRPLCLYREGSKLVRLNQGFAMCKTYEHWIGTNSHVLYREELSA